MSLTRLSQFIKVVGGHFTRSVFLVVFIWMLGWQYSEKVCAMRSYVTNHMPPKEQTVEPSNVAESFQQLVSSQTTQVAPQFDRVAVVPKNITNLTKVGIKELLVTDWSSAITKLNEQSNKVLLQSYNIDEKLNTQTNRSLVPKQPAIVEDIEAQTDTVNDYQIEDKFKVNITPISSQKGERLANTEQIQTTAFLKPEPGMLLALPNKHFVIQIAAMANIIILQDYVREQQLSQQLWLYKTQRYNVDWFVLLKNQHFSSIEAARVEIINLADAVLKNTPFVKSIEQVKQEISVSEP
jgi:DamX protein